VTALCVCVCSAGRKKKSKYGVRGVRYGVGEKDGGVERSGETDLLVGEREKENVIRRVGE